jgi:hypothetical protein
VCSLGTLTLLVLGIAHISSPRLPMLLQTQLRYLLLRQTPAGNKQCVASLEGIRFIPCRTIFSLDVGNHTFPISALNQPFFKDFKNSIYIIKSITEVATISVYIFRAISRPISKVRDLSTTTPSAFMYR